MNPKIDSLWVNLTVVLPGMVTYAALRLVMLITGYDADFFKAVDDSVVLSTCMVFAFALLQQTIGITIEALATRIVTRVHNKREKSKVYKKDKLEYAYKLFNRRFAGYVSCEHKGEALRTIAQFFLSLNITVGQAAVLVFIVTLRNPLGQPALYKPVWLYALSGLLVFFSVCAACFRYWNAVEVIKEAEQESKVKKGRKGKNG